MTEEQQQLLARLAGQMDDMVRFQEEVIAKDDAREAEAKANRAQNKREVFAAMAMQGLMATCATDPRVMTQLALQHADTLLKALEQESLGRDG